MEKFDVVIIGAGPGGLRAAEVLGRAGRKVLLLEKNETIGPKVCAGGLSRKCFKLLGIDPSFAERSFESAVFQAPGCSARLKFGELFGYTIRRERLAEWQLQRLTGLDLVVRTKAAVRKITPRSVFVNEREEIGYDYLIGADGSNSLVRRFLGLRSEKIGVAFHYLVPRPFPEIEIFFDSQLFGPWYAWIFPYRDSASIGFGCFPKVMPMQVARANFEKWLEKSKIDITEGKFESFPINCDYQGVAFGNIFLIGDAAGLASGFTGEGIYQALVSGEEAARKIIDSGYRMPRIRELRREVRIHHLLLRIVYFAGPLRNPLFNLVTWAVKNKKLARLLGRILT